MGEIKTKVTVLDVDSFLNSIEPAKRRTDSIELKKVFDEVTGEKAALWNNNMIGYGSYHYKSDKSKQEGNWPLTGFSPRKQNITIYIMPGVSNYETLIAKLGKVKVSSGSCIYINKIEDVDKNILKELIAISVADMNKKFNFLTP
jgi:hypothetical protein